MLGTIPIASLLGFSLQELFPIIIGALYKNSKQHWNSAVRVPILSQATGYRILDMIDMRNSCCSFATSSMVHESIVPEVHGLTFNVLKLLMEAVNLKEIDLTCTSSRDV